jgi:hypothetical protein
VASLAGFAVCHDAGLSEEILSPSLAILCSSNIELRGLSWATRCCEHSYQSSRADHSDPGVQNKSRGHAQLRTTFDKWPSTRNNSSGLSSSAAPSVSISGRSNFVTTAASASRVASPRGISGAREPAFRFVQAALLRFEIVILFLYHLPPKPGQFFVSQ